jgi:error-prone DNA polymerase
MAAWKRHGGLEPHRERLRQGMLARGYDEGFAGQLFEQIKGFGEYGFPESHAASYALVAYVSCWLKHHEPAAFACALVNIPGHMGFYTPDQILQDARRHGIRVQPVDVRYSDWECSLEALPADATRQPAIRIGFNQVTGFGENAALRIMQARRQAEFRDADDLAARAGLDRKALAALAEANALRGLSGHRNRARWSAAGIDAGLPLFAGSQAAAQEETIRLAPPGAGESVLADYASTGLTLGPHPLKLLRRQLRARRCRPSRELAALPHGSPARHAGLVTLRQRPQTAKGVTFVTLEDEDGSVNVVVWRDLAERQRRELVGSRLLAVDGRWETVDGVSHLIAQRLHDLSPLLGTLRVASHDYR